MVQEYLIALGSNLGSDAGSPQITLDAALSNLTQRGVTLTKHSRLFATPCFPAGAGPDYMNACAVVNLNGSAQDLLRIMHEVEAEFGRERETRWGSRTLDLDLIAAGNAVLPDTRTHNHWMNLSPEAQRTETPFELILPHPRLQDRAFVLVPLADVAPDWVHPILGLSVLEMRDKLPQELCAEVVAVSG